MEMVGQDKVVVESSLDWGCWGSAFAPAGIHHREINQSHLHSVGDACCR